MLAGAKTPIAASATIWPYFHVTEPTPPTMKAVILAGEDTLWEKEPMQHLATNGQLAAFRHDGFWQPMDTLRDKNHLEELWAGGPAPWKLWP